MSTPRILDEIGARLSELAANSPVRDIEKNAKAMLGSAFGKLDLVTREEFEVQREVLAQARRKLAELEARVAELEAKLSGGDKASSSCVSTRCIRVWRRSCGNRQGSRKPRRSGASRERTVGGDGRRDTLDAAFASA